MMDLVKKFGCHDLQQAGLRMMLLLVGAASLSRGIAAEKASPALVLDVYTPWVVAADQPEPIQRALKDLERDWYKVFGRRPSVVQEKPEGWKGPLIYLGHVGSTI